MSQTQLKVQLLSCTPEPEKVITAAAKLCYSSTNIGELLNNLTHEKIESFIKMLESIGHESPFEHVSFVFGIEGVSRSLTHQLVRHRIASYSQKSQRYVTEGQFQYIIPPEIEKMPEARLIFIKSMEKDQQDYNNLFQLLKDKHFHEALLNKFGVEKIIDSSKMLTKEEKKIWHDLELTAEKKAAEDARFVLPNAAETKIIGTFNARTLFNFFHHRTCNRAQWEIRALAIEMLKLVKNVAPNIFKNAGPNCLNGPCPEKAMTCGEITEVRKMFRNI